MAGKHGDADMDGFYAAWLSRSEAIAAALAAVPVGGGGDVEAARRRLVGEALAHYHAYYVRKSAVAEYDVVRALDPRWLTSLERVYLRIGGFRPALLFRFLPSDDADDRRHRDVEDLKAAVAEEERLLAREMAGVQESLGGPAVVSAVRRRRENPETVEQVAVVVAERLRNVLAAADARRKGTLRDIAGILSPVQAAAFLAAALRFHLCVRRAGELWKNAHRNG